jgi:hypothetical protein
MTMMETMVMMRADFDRAGLAGMSCMDGLNIYDEIRKLPLRAVGALMLAQVDQEPELATMDTAWGFEPETSTERAPS